MRARLARGRRREKHSGQRRAHPEHHPSTIPSAHGEERSRPETRRWLVVSAHPLRSTTLRRRTRSVLRSAAQTPECLHGKAQAAHRHPDLPADPRLHRGGPGRLLKLFRSREFEAHWPSVFYAWFQSALDGVAVEEATSRGRLDLAVRLRANVYLFEFKVAERGAALAQLRATPAGRRRRTCPRHRQTPGQSGLPALSRCWSQRRC